MNKNYFMINKKKSVRDLKKFSKLILENKKQFIICLILLICIIVVIISVYKIIKIEMVQNSGITSKENSEINYKNVLILMKSCEAGLEQDLCMSQLLVANRQMPEISSGEICSRLGFLEKSCYLHIAVLFGNEKFCNELETRDEKLNCMAFSTEDIEVCNEIEDEDIMNSCLDNFSEVIRERNDAIG